MAVHMSTVKSWMGSTCLLLSSLLSLFSFSVASLSSVVPPSSPSLLLFSWPLFTSSNSLFVLAISNERMLCVQINLGTTLVTTSSYTFNSNPVKTGGGACMDSSGIFSSSLTRYMKQTFTKFTTSICVNWSMYTALYAAMMEVLQL